MVGIYDKKSLTLLSFAGLSKVKNLKWFGQETLLNQRNLQGQLSTAVGRSVDLKGPKLRRRRGSFAYAVEAPHGSNQTW